MRLTGMSLPAIAVLGVSFLFGSSASPGARGAAPAPGREPIVGLPCEGCEAVFDGLPETVPARSRIAPKDESGEPMRIEGTVKDANGRPAAGVIVYAYHTNAKGIYPTDEGMRGRDAYRHGRLRGWAKTDQQGRYIFDTIRPAGYPDTRIPAHVHMHIIEPGRCTYFIDEIHFLDDPRLSELERRQAGTGRGGSGLVAPRKDDGVWVVVRDIILGEKIPGYPGTAKH